MSISCRYQKNGFLRDSESGFTLLEVVIVLFILGLISAMAWSGLGMLDNAERKKQTLETMAVIRDAIMGPSGRYDEKGLRIIGGYVGDMKKFPDLWEARAEVRPDFSGTSWPNPGAGMGQGGQDPDPDSDLYYAMNPAYVFFRPSGSFTHREWRWNRPYRRLYDDPSDADHIGGLETENEGQPRGLWTYYTEDLTSNLLGHPEPGLTEGSLWKGPYLLAPAGGRTDSGSHLAKTDNEYNDLAPAWDSISGNETWEDGDYDAATLGELYDDKEMFRNLNTDGRLSDAWGRALKFFITPDPDRTDPEHEYTIFWIISEGPDKEGRYPTKGTCSGHTWTVDASDTMETNYDETAAENQDNIVMKIYSHEYKTVFDAREQALQDAADDQVQTVRQALAGQAPFGNNTGFTGDVGSLPDLFQWETDHWDNQDSGGDDYTKGQPRGLWTQTPNSTDAGDDIDAYAWGMGWRTRYIEPPAGILENEILTDPWDRELLFFSDIAGQAMLILSRGPDGQFDFGTVNAEKTEPDNLTETVDVTAYDPALPENRDNHYQILYRHEYGPGHFTVGRITVLNAASGTTRARLIRGEGAAATQTLVCATLTDEDGDGAMDDWGQGVWPGTPCWQYDNLTAEKVLTGSRKLVFWNDTDADNEMDTGETYTARSLNILAVPGSGQLEEITVNTNDFLPVP